MSTLDGVLNYATIMKVAREGDVLGISSPQAEKIESRYWVCVEVPIPELWS